MFLIKNLKMNTIGQRLKQLRESKKLTQDEFSKNLSVKKLQIGLIENDKSGMSLDLATEISKFYGCSIDWLAKGEGSLNSNEVNEPEEIYRTKYYELLEKHNKVLEEKVEKQEERIRERLLHT